MLRVLGATHGWQHGATLKPLPDTLPGWTIAYLALAGDWVPRERLCALLWPQAASAEAQHSLRVNLHRMRGVLAAWGQAQALQAERRRVRLTLPTDAAALRDACADGSAPVPLPGALLDGVVCDGFPALREWLELERTGIAARWRQAQMALLARGDPASEQTVAVARELLAVDPLDEKALERLLSALRALARDEEADRLYLEYRERLARELGTEPSPAIRALASGAMTAAERAPAPPQASFVGRRLESAELERRLASGARLVTITGPGGVGKSALAREAVARSARATLWIDLQDLADLDAVAARIAQRLGAPLRDGADAVAQLAAALGAAPRLLVLDNAEHLPELPAFTARLLSAAPAVAVLATSRAPLGVADESVLVLHGLALPDEDSRDPEAAQAFDAIRLLALRAQAARADFELGRHVEAVIAIAEAVDGLPLALELAAGWVRHLAPATIARELRETLDVLARAPQAAGLPARPEHRSMAAVLQRTWSLLAPSEAQALEAVSVFEGGFTRAAAAAVADASLPLLTALADRGLLRVDADGRFDMHPLVREYARTRLQSEPARARQVRDAHAVHFAELLSAALSRHPDDDQRIGEAVQAEYANARAAWKHALASKQDDPVLKMTPVWRRHFEAQGRYEEACRHFETSDRDASSETLAQAFVRIHRAHFLVRCYAPALAWPLALEALQRAETLGDLTLRSSCTSTLGGCAMALGRFDEAAQWFGRALELNRESGNRAGEAAALNSLGVVAIYRGRPDEALRHVEQALALYRARGNAAGVARALVNKSQLLLWPVEAGPQAQRAADATEAAREALQHAVQHNLAALATLAQFYLGLARQTLNDCAAARDHFRRCGERCVEQDNRVFGLKVEYHLAYLDSVDGDSARAEAGQRALLAAARTARERGYEEDVLHIALLIADRLRDAGAVEEARQLACSVENTPQPPSDAFVHALARRSLATLPPGAGEAAPLPFDVIADMLAASSSLAEVGQRLTATRAA